MASHPSNNKSAKDRRNARLPLVSHLRLERRMPFRQIAAEVERQLGYYKELMDRAGNRKVIFRSLDVGSDKLLPYWSNMGEENPACLLYTSDAADE